MGSVSAILVATGGGCRVIGESGQASAEMVGHSIGALAAEPEGSCLAVVDSTQVWRRDPWGQWALVAETGMPLQSLARFVETAIAGGNDEAALLRLQDGRVERLEGMDRVAGRQEWFAGGPPLGVRSIAVTADAAAMLAVVHVGGIPRSLDGGETWSPTIPILWDAHEARTHPALPNFAAAATAIGLIVSEDWGGHWTIVAEGLTNPNALAVAVLEREVLLATSAGPFANRSQLWRWPILPGRLDARVPLELVEDGLPEWLDGKVDTGWIATWPGPAGMGQAALLDGAGNLWLSRSGSTGWRQIAEGLPYSAGIALLAHPAVPQAPE